MFAGQMKSCQKGQPKTAVGQPVKMQRRGQSEVTFAARAKSSNMRTASLRYEAGIFWVNFRNCFQSQGRLGN